MELVSLLVKAFRSVFFSLCHWATTSESIYAIFTLEHLHVLLVFICSL